MKPSNKASEMPVVPTSGAPFAWPGMAGTGGANTASAWGPVGEYMTDAMQRTILFWDVLRQRSDQYYAQKAKAVPHVLSFDAELVLDARTFDTAGQLPAGARQAAAGRRGSIRASAPSSSSIRAPATGRASAASRPTARSAWRMRAGHPCYFVGFTPEPSRARRSRTSCRAEAAFLETVIALHPEAEGKPCVIGNCQARLGGDDAGADAARAVRPDHRAPVRRCPTGRASRGKNPMRYTGGLLGGSWLTALTGDLGARQVRRRAGWCRTSRA